MTGTLEVLAIGGSLRASSYNRLLLEAAAELAPPGLKVSLLSLADVPLYNADVEAAGDPAPVAALKDAILRADGLLLATPEYNHGVPGVLKNAIDWASRPPEGSVLRGKPVAIMGASPGLTGTARAQSQLRQAFVFTNSWCMAQPEMLLSHAAQKFGWSGALTDPSTRDYLAVFMTSFRNWLHRLLPVCRQQLAAPGAAGPGHPSSTSAMEKVP